MGSARWADRAETCAEHYLEFRIFAYRMLTKSTEALGYGSNSDRKTLISLVPVAGFEPATY